AQLPKGEKNPLSARARSSQVEKRTVKIGVGLLPYVWIGSVWQKRRPVITNLSAYRGRVSIDATSLRMVALGMATSRDNAIPRSSYLFGTSWPNVCRTLLVAVEQDGDPYAVMVPTAEIIRFYYGPSTRLAQALFWGEYHNIERVRSFAVRVVLPCRSDGYFSGMIFSNEASSCRNSSSVRHRGRIVGGNRFSTEETERMTRIISSVPRQ